MNLFPWHSLIIRQVRIRMAILITDFRMHSKNFRTRMRDRASFFAVRSWSPSRAFCSSSLLFLSYLLRPSSLSMSFLPTLAIALFPWLHQRRFSLLVSISFYADAAVALFSHFNKDLLSARSDLLSSRRLVLSFCSTSKLLRSAPAKFKVHVNTHAQNVPLKISIRIDRQYNVSIIYGIRIDRSSLICTHPS